MPIASHLAPILEHRLPGGGHALLLADAFSEFIGASARLELSYRELQGEVAQLGSELAARNCALEGSLRREEQMRLALAEVVDSMPCGVLVLGAGKRLLRINPEARRILGLAVRDEHPQPATDLDALSQSLAVDLARFAAMEGESEFSFLTGDAGRRWVEVRTRPMTGEASEVETILILRDVSAHKQAEQDRDAGRRALAQAELATTLAHEIRNPLAGLELFVSLLEEEPARSGEWVGHLRAGVRGLSAVVNNMLSYHGAGFLPLSVIVMAEAMEAAAAFVRPLAVQAGIALSVCCAERTGRVMGNAAALQQIVLNLVANAVRASRAGTAIVIALSPGPEGTLRLRVSDTGAGIAAEHLPHIFDPGWSVGGASTGLGLAVCQRIAAQHGSVLTVSSVVGQGTTFAMEMATV